MKTVLAALLLGVAFPDFWTALASLYGLVSPNGSFGSLAYSQMSAPLLIQSASLLDMYSCWGLYQTLGCAVTNRASSGPPM